MRMPMEATLEAYISSESGIWLPGSRRYPRHYFHWVNSVLTKALRFGKAKTWNKKGLLLKLMLVKSQVARNQGSTAICTSFFPNNSSVFVIYRDANKTNGRSFGDMLLRKRLRALLHSNNDCVTILCSALLFKIVSTACNENSFFTKR